MSVKIKKSEYQNYADCIRSDQVSAAGFVDLFKDFKIKIIYFADNLPKNIVTLFGRINVGIANMKIKISPK